MPPRPRTPTAPTRGAALLRTWTARHGLTRDELAQQLECSPATASYLLTGDRRPSLDLAARIAEVTRGAVSVASWVQELQGELPELPERRGRPKGRPARLGRPPAKKGR